MARADAAYSRATPEHRHLARGIDDRATGTSLTPIELVMAVSGEDSETAASWLLECVAPLRVAVEADEQSDGPMFDVLRHMRDVLIHTRQLLRDGRPSLADAALGRTIDALGG